MLELHETVERKFVESYELDDLEIWTDTGWQDVTDLHVTVPYEEWTVITDSGKNLHCADTHILFDENMDQIFAENLVPGHSYIQTENGPERVTELTNSKNKATMYDLTVNSTDHRFYSNGILSHNTTAYSGYFIWYILFRPHSRCAILANKEKTATKILDFIKKSYELLPLWIQQGILVWNKTSIELENGSSIFCAATAGSGIRGESINLLLLDEFAHVPNNIADDFFASTYPVISSAKTSKIAIVSTPNGMNLFFNIWKSAKRGPGNKGWNKYVPVEVTWREHPDRDEKWKEDTLSQIGPDKFAQEYECEFMGSSDTLINGKKLSALSYEDPIYTNLDGLRIYENPVKDNTYVGVVDCSHGIGQDYHTVQIIDISQVPYKQVATFRNNLMDAFTFPTVVYQLGKMYNEAWILGEINDIGKQIMDILYHELEYSNIIRVSPSAKEGKSQTAGGWGTGRLNIGLTQTRSTKTVGCTSLKSLIEQDKLIIVDLNTISELSTFSKGDGSTYEAEYGMHDDLVMPLVCFGWLTTQPFFRDLSDTSVRQNLHAKKLMELENEILPIGFRSTGDNVETIVNLGDGNPWRVKEDKKSRDDAWRIF